VVSLFAPLALFLSFSFFSVFLFSIAAVSPVAAVWYDLTATHAQVEAFATINKTNLAALIGT